MARPAMEVTMAGALRIAATTPAPAPGAMRPLLRTTRSLAPRQQLEFWRSCSSLVEFDAAPATQGFAGEEATWRLGRLALMTAEVGALRYRRSAAQTRRDGLDHWTVSVALRGSRRFATARSALTMAPGAAYLSSLATPYEVERPDSAWVHLFVPREELSGLRDGAEPIRLSGPLGAALHDHLLLLGRVVASLRREEAETMGRVTRELLAGTLRSEAPRAAGFPLEAEAGLAAIRLLVRRHLGSARFGPARLAALAGLSRTRLYELCEPEGGVAALIQAERLQRARRAIEDPADRRSLREIAASAGLFDVSSFGRMFRRRYGCTPRDMRRAALGGGEAEGRRDASDLASLLREL
jgi:AraC-like DNA-binding protein